MNARIAKLIGVVMVATMLVTACAPAATPTESMATDVFVPTEAPMATAAPTEAPTMAPTEAMSQIDCMGASSGDAITIVYQWTGSEEENFNTILKPLVDACGIKVTAQSTRDDAVLDTMVKSTPPDVLFWPNFSPLKLYADKLLPIASVGAQVDNYASFWSDMGMANGQLVALPFKADVKSIIWYSPANFAAYGYNIPTTFDELNTLVEKMVADGNVPWSMGQGSDAATGWTGSDFIQDELLATQGPAFVNSIISGDTPYNDPAVVSAYETYFKWASDAKYTVGGADGTLNTTFGDAILKVFSNPAEAMMVKQSGFAGGNVVAAYPDLKYGTDFDFFMFPGAQGLQGGADLMYAFSDSPAAKALVNYLTSEIGAVNMAATNWGLSPNKYAAGNYPDAQLGKLGDMLASTSGFTFDMGDAIGAPFNTAEWTAIVNIVQGQDIQSNLDTVAAAQTEALK
jgi:alpha-glucoside transport system substrate-binding protein